MNQQAQSTAHAKILVPAAEAAAMLSMGKSTFWREVKNENLPAPVKIGGLTRWRVADLQRIADPGTAAADIVRS